MNTFQLNSANEQGQPEEMDIWELRDFDDVLEGFEESKLENEIIRNNDFRWDAGCFH